MKKNFEFPEIELLKLHTENILARDEESSTWDDEDAMGWA